MSDLTSEERDFLKSELDCLYQQAVDHAERFGHLRLPVRLEANRKRRIIKAILAKLIHTGIILD